MKHKLALDDIAEVKRRKTNIEECIVKLGKEADKLSITAEKNQDFTILAKANSFRATQEKKAEEVKEIE